ncbi:hypothetical protein IV203_010935 [Nitzschia inconspicua]|uniref:Exostosin GT47 domain-containing protein n=1 Tax=Nitzschia inconspicua TaxID=303405 RepID=A0A9K3KX17_9STRA|nr:hypothetical protein IV203_010935 [Nitzschia inconspicua]
MKYRLRFLFLTIIILVAIPIIIIVTIAILNSFTVPVSSPSTISSKTKIDPPTIQTTHPSSSQSHFYSNTTKGFSSSSSFLQPALDCLGYHNNNHNNNKNVTLLRYPMDPWDHYHEIHSQYLKAWMGRSNVPYHKAPGYKGPWMENVWQDRVQKLVATTLDNHNFHTVFGPYIPLTPAWTDIYVDGGYKTETNGSGAMELVTALRDVLRPNVIYITVCQNDDGFPGNDPHFERIQRQYNILVLSSGGYGHVPIPLLKQPEYTVSKTILRRAMRVPVHKRRHFVSYVGSLHHAPDDMRRIMMMMDTIGYDHYYYGRWKWRHMMYQSKFSLCPRGFGRTSYHVMETLQMGLIPIQVYIDDDIPWMPYSSTILSNISFTTSLSNLPILIQQLKNMSDSEIDAIEHDIRRFIPDYFTYDGVWKQILLFMIRHNDDNNDHNNDDDHNFNHYNYDNTALQCQPLPKHPGTNRPKYFPPTKK